MNGGTIFRGIKRAGDVVEDVYNNDPTFSMVIDKLMQDADDNEDAFVDTVIRFIYNTRIEYACIANAIINVGHYDSIIALLKVTFGEEWYNEFIKEAGNQNTNNINTLISSLASSYNTLISESE